jgi:hypothetical protein
MSKGKLVATESVRIAGMWRNVEVYIDPLTIACQMAKRAELSKSQQARAVFGGVRVKVLPKQ